MAKKQSTKLVEQPPSVDEQVETSEEESGGVQEELFKTPSSSAKIFSVSAAGKHASDSDSGSETQPSAGVALPKKKRKIEEESSTCMNVKRLNAKEKKPLFRRLWTEDDEIILLQKIIDFGMDPFKDKTRFHEYVKSSISIKVTNSQLMAKIESLGMKFLGKEEKCVEKFLKPHDHLCFEMSKVIWGVNGIAVKSTVKNKVEEEDRKNVVLIDGEDDWFEKSFLVEAVASFGFGEEFVKEGWRLVPTERKMKIQEKVRRLLEVEGDRSVLCKVDIVRDVGYAIVEARR